MSALLLLVGTWFEVVQVFCVASQSRWAHSCDSLVVSIKHCYREFIPHPCSPAFSKAFHSLFHVNHWASWGALCHGSPISEWALHSPAECLCAVCSHWQKKLLQWGLRDAQICPCSSKSLGVILTLCLCSRINVLALPCSGTMTCLATGSQPCSHLMKQA